HTALQEDREFLIAKGQLEQDLVEWQATPVERQRGALLSGNKLGRARHWLMERPQDLTCDERRFINASADAEIAEADRREELRRVAVANESRALVAFSRKANLEMKPVEAIKLALASWPRDSNSDRPCLESALTIISATLAKHWLYRTSVKHNGVRGA